MDVGLLVPLAAPFATPEFVEVLGCQAEQKGFSALWVGEHVVVPEEWESIYPAGDGHLPAEIQKGELDPFTTLCYLAAVTRRIRLGACCNVAQRNPVYTAKEAANVDWLSRGRLEFGVGVGWAKEEFAACGMPFARRGSRARSHMEVVRRLWREPAAQYRDEFYELPPSLLYPKPTQAGGVPIHCLGESRPALQRVAEFGDGFFPLSAGPGELAGLLTTLDELLEECGRTRAEITVSATGDGASCGLDEVKRYRDAGAQRMIMMPFVDSLQSLEPTLDRLAEEIVHPARAL